MRTDFKFTKEQPKKYCLICKKEMVYISGVNLNTASVHTGCEIEFMKERMAEAIDDWK